MWNLPVYVVFSFQNTRLASLSLFIHASRSDILIYALRQIFAGFQLSRSTDGATNVCIVRQVRVRLHSTLYVSLFIYVGVSPYLSLSLHVNMYPGVSPYISPLESILRIGSTWVIYFWTFICWWGNGVNELSVGISSTFNCRASMLVHVASG